MTNDKEGRPTGPPRLPSERRPRISVEGLIPPDADSLDYDLNNQRLLIGTGFIENVPAAVWRYEVSGKRVLTNWFSYRRKNRERPIIGDRREPSPLGNIQPAGWLAEYTTELLNVLNVLAWLVELEPAQADLLTRICAGPLISTTELAEAGVHAVEARSNRVAETPAEPELFAVDS